MLLHDPWYITTKVTDGVGDALWRTGFAYITYKNAYFRVGMLKCFKERADKKGRYLQAYRHHTIPTHGVSRDQIISALVAFKFHEDLLHLFRICGKLRWKLSRQPEKFDKMPWLIIDIAKFFSEARITLDMWLWMKAISNNSKFYGGLFSLISFFIVGLSQLWNKVLYKLARLKVCSPDILLDFKPLRNPNDFEKKIFKLHYPAYAFHLFAWQLYTTPDNLIKRICKKMCLSFTEKSNYLLILLFGGKVSRNDIENYKPMNGIRWQSIFFEGLYDGTEMIEPHPILSDLYSSEDNVLDNDLLWTVADKHPNQII